MTDIAKLSGVAIGNLSKVDGVAFGSLTSFTNLTFPGGSVIGLTANSIQGVFGEFEAVLDNTVTTTQNQIQGVFGEFTYVIDNSNVGL